MAEWIPLSEQLKGFKNRPPRKIPSDPASKTLQEKMKQAGGNVAYN